MTPDLATFAASWVGLHVLLLGLVVALVVFKRFGITR